MLRRVVQVGDLRKLGSEPGRLAAPEVIPGGAGLVNCIRLASGLEGPVVVSPSAWETSTRLRWVRRRSPQAEGLRQRGRPAQPVPQATLASTKERQGCRFTLMGCPFVGFTTTAALDDRARVGW
jgi:hypothetical protein